MIDTSLDSSNFYFLLAVFQGLVLSSIIVFQKPFRKPNLFLGILIFLYSLSLLHLLLEESIHAFNAYYPIPMDFSLAFGPLAYFHVLYIKDPSRRFRSKDLLHFAPSFVLDGILFTTIFLLVRVNMDWANSHVQTIQTFGLVMAIFGLIQQCIYTYLIYKESKATRHVLKEFSNVRKWLKYLLVCWSMSIIFLVIALPLALYYIEELDDNSFLIYKPLGIIVGLCIYILGYFYLIKYQRIVGSYSDRVKNFKFSPSDIDLKKEQILNALRTDKLYEDSSLTVAKLAGHLGWPINNLSRMINETLDTNFNDLINKHRVDAFKEKLLQPDSRKYSILGLGQGVGFSSKASFYRAFKKETGITPSDYLKSQGK